MSNNLFQVSSKYTLAKDMLVLTLAGGRGSRLRELTDERAKSTLYFGGNRRIVDSALSNCINSGLNHTGVITQYATHSSLRHLQKGWSFLSQERGEFIDMLPTRQRIDDFTWCCGTADAVYQSVAVIRDHYKPKYILILAGDHIYKQDYGQMLLDHINSDARCTVSCTGVPRSEASEFGVIAISKNLRVKDLMEKPKDPPPVVGKSDVSLALMGAYVSDADHPYEMLNKEVSMPYTPYDFGKNMLPRCLEESTPYAHPFSRPYMGRNTEGGICWRGVGILDSFWQFNIDLVSEHPQLDIYDRSWPTQGNPVQSYPSEFFYKSANIEPVDNSLISGGCVITGASIGYSVLFDRIRINEDSSVDHPVALPEVITSKNCILRHCIIDRHCIISDDMRIGVDKESDRERFCVSSSGRVVLVTPTMLKQLEGGDVPEEGYLD